MNYKKIYDSIIERAKNSEAIKLKISKTLKKKGKLSKEHSNNIRLGLLNMYKNKKK